MFRQNSSKVAPTENESEVINNQLRHICDWLDENPAINARRDLDNLLFFLRSCKYDIERTKKKLKCFYQMRAERVEWFASRDPFLPELQALLSLGVFLPVDGVDEEQRKIVIIRTAAHDPKKHSQNDVFKVSKMILDLLLKLEPENCVHIVAIFDMDGVQLGHALQMNPTLIKHSVHSWQAYPCQPKLLEFVNVPMHVNLILNTFRVFMTAKMRSRVVVRKDVSAVKSNNLPRDIGGHGIDYKDLTLKWKRLVEQNAHFYAEDEKFKSILSP